MSWAHPDVSKLKAIAKNLGLHVSTEFRSETDVVVYRPIDASCAECRMVTDSDLVGRWTGHPDDVTVLSSGEPILTMEKGALECLVGAQIHHKWVAVEGWTLSPLMLSLFLGSIPVYTTDPVTFSPASSHLGFGNELQGLLVGCSNYHALCVRAEGWLPSEVPSLVQDFQRVCETALPVPSVIGDRKSGVTWHGMLAVTTETFDNKHLEIELVGTNLTLAIRLEEMDALELARRLISAANRTENRHE